MFLIGSEVCVGLRVGCARYLATLALRVVVDKDVAVVCGDGHRLVFRQLAVCARRKPRFIFGEFAQARAVAVDDVQIHLLQTRLARLFPTEIDALAILRPIDARRLIADETKTAHDAINRQLETLWWCLRRWLLRDRELSSQERQQAERTRRTA